MIGNILGIIAALGFLGAAFNGDASYFIGFIGAALIAVLVGVFLFPRTVGFTLMWIQFASPIAIIGGGLTNGWGVFFGSLAVLILATVAGLIIGFLRPDATGYIR